MRDRLRFGMAVLAVALVAGVSVSAALLNPPGGRTWLVVCGIAATATAVQALSSEPRDLIPALLLALIPVVGLASQGAPSWLGAPMVCLLLLAGELCALTWEGPAGMAEDGFLAPRLQEVGLLAAVGLGVAALLAVAGLVSAPRGTWAVVVGSLALMGIAGVVFGRGGTAAEGGATPGEG